MIVRHCCSPSTLCTALGPTRSTSCSVVFEVRRRHCFARGRSAHAGADADAAAQFSKLSGLQVAQADYGTALLALRDSADAWAHADFGSARAHARQALTQLGIARARGTGRFKVSQLKLVAESLASTTDPADVNWQDAADQPWTARLLGLARLVRAPESVDADLVQRLPEWLPPETHGAALAQAALRVVLLAEADAARLDAVNTLIHLGERSSNPEISRAVRRGAAGIRLRDGDGTADVPGDPLTALVRAGLALDKSDPAEAVRRLRPVESEGGKADQVAFVTVLANALEGKALPTPCPSTRPRPLRPPCRGSGDRTGRRRGHGGGYGPCCWRRVPSSTDERPRWISGGCCRPSCRTPPSAAVTTRSPR